jgi:hypothetical protein
MTDLLRNLLDVLSIAREAIEADAGEYRPAYNGWKNRETWSASLWINNDEGLYEQANEILRDHFEDPQLDGTDAANWPAEQQRPLIIHMAGEYLKEWYEESTDPGVPLDGPIGDAWTAALEWTDWDEIARTIAAALEL